MRRCISRTEIESVYGVIAPHVRVTPVLQLDGRELSLSAFPLAVKLEQMQFAGSFKTRGAFANLLLRQVPACGVVAASGGNHGAAVAYAAMARRVLSSHLRAQRVIASQDGPHSVVRR